MTVKLVEKAKVAVPVLLGCVLLAIMMLPYARNGFWFDDSLNSQIWGMLNRFDTNVWTFSIRVTRHWLEDAGRLLFVWPAIYGFFYFVRDALAVRLIDLAMLATHVGLTVYLLRRLRIEWATIGLFVLFLMPLFQIRYSHDPIASYAIFTQGLGIILVCALLMLHRWWVGGSPAWLVGSSLIAVASMTLYELNVVYVPIALAAVATGRSESRTKAYTAVLAPFALFVVANILAKHGAPHAYDGSSVGQAAAIPVTFAKQLIAALPGSFYVLLGHQSLSLGALLRETAGNWMAWIVCALWSALVFRMLYQRSLSTGSYFAACFGASMLLLVPPVLISLSARYQTTLTWGDAHIPVYYEYFGLAFLAAALVSRIIAGRMLVIAPIVVLAGVCVAANWTMNMHQSTVLDAAFREPRDSLVSAINGGLLDPVRDGDIVRIEGQPIYINGNLIYQAARKRVVVEDEAAVAGWFSPSPRPDATRYRLFRVNNSGKAWQIAPQ